MRNGIATVSLGGTLRDKLSAIAEAGFEGVELFETDIIAHDGPPAPLELTPWAQLDDDWGPWLPERLWGTPREATGTDGWALDWEAAKGIPWGVLLLFGGGLALAGGFQVTGLAGWIGERVSGFEVGTWVLVFIVAAAIVYLTEITSNTASTATFPKS